VHVTEISPELADAADVLSDQLRAHLQRLAVTLQPHAEQLHRKFLGRLRGMGFEPKIRAALAALTPGAAACILGSGKPALKFIEQVEYNGRRLAKFNISPSSIVEALQEYDRLLTPALKRLMPGEYTNLQWVREQLHFCVILTLNNAYYQVREAETQSFYELFRVELESRNLDELLRSFLRTLVRVCSADAGHLYLLDDARKNWVCRASARATGRVDNKGHLLPVTAAGVRKLSRPWQIDLSAGHGSALDQSWSRRFSSCWSIPVATKGHMAGVIQFAFEKPYEWLPREQ
jgi:hypothetical protein